MAMNKTAMQTAIIASLSQRMFDTWGAEVNTTVEDYVPLATMLAEEVAGAVIDEILARAEDSFGGSIT